jgi:hypothetical protein
VAGRNVNFLHQIFVHVVGTNPILQGLAGGVVIASLNMIGALSVLVWRNLRNDRSTERSGSPPA